MTGIPAEHHGWLRQKDRQTDRQRIICLATVGTPFAPGDPRNRSNLTATLATRQKPGAEITVPLGLGRASHLW